MQRIKTFGFGLALSATLVCSGVRVVSAVEPGKTAAEAGNKSECQVSVHDAHPACSESTKVIETLKYMASLLAKGDLKTYGEYLDEGCTSFDENTHKLVVGKENILANTRKEMAELGKDPVITISIEEPYAKVTGDVAVVTFTGIWEVGGEHPLKEELRATDVFVKHGDKWRKLHCRGEWKKL